MLKFLYRLTVLSLAGLLILPALVFANPYEDTFIITGYYSPLPDQERYATGSYEGDKRLNGNGTNGASGAEVFPGMIAAPKSYAFGTKIYIPGIGMTEIQDRGGAIVNAGQRGNAHDRLDIWLGAGDTGLRRALLWGKRAVNATVYGLRPDLAVNVVIEDWNHNEIELVRYWKEHAPSYVGNGLVATLFTKDLWQGETSEKVQEMQDLLANLGYLYEGDASGYYDDATARAVFHFQRDNDIVVAWDEMGAGHFGPTTRATIEKAKELNEKGEYYNQTISLNEIQKHEDLKEDFHAFTDELYEGVNSDSVAQLQEELAALGYLRTEATGEYEEVTKNAVMRFQLKQGIISSKSDHGAGVVGPKTRAALNEIFDSRIETKGMIAQKRSEGGEPGELMIAAVEK